MNAGLAKVCASGDTMDISMVVNRFELARDKTSNIANINRREYV